MLPELHDYELSHELDRIGQSEAFEAVMKWFLGPKQYMILSAPTGIGKTGIIAKMVKYVRVMALARTKVLLTSVYRDSYGFEELQGKMNHPCLRAPHTHKADVCAIPDDVDKQDRYDMCEGSGLCSYYVQYNEFCQSPKAVTTYAKFISDRRPYNTPSLYVFDEAHEVQEIVIEQSGLNLNVNRNSFLKGFGDTRYNEDMGHEEAVKVMRKLYSVALENTPELKKPLKKCSAAEVVDYKRRLIRHRQFLKRIEGAAKLMIESERKDLNVWHCSSTDDGDFSARPMTAAYHFKHILNTGTQKTLLMSATISEVAAELLGLTDDEFEYYEAPQQYPVSMRPIYDLGMGGMGTKAVNNSPALYNIQAIKISNVLKTRPDVTSVILVTSKAKARALSEKLTRMGHDVFTPPMTAGTDLQLKAWENYRKPGAVCVSYNFWEGVSLDLDHMLFIAGIKFPDLGSPFERARMNRAIKEFLYRAGIYVVQGSGRIQRGHLSDYLPLGNKQVFIVDGNWKRIKNFAPGDFAERIVPWDK